jgi:hypothetical protein
MKAATTMNTMNKVKHRFAHAAKLALAMAIAGSLTGCAELAYDVLQTDAQEQCKKLVNLDERNACTKRHDKKYDAYEKDRSKLLKLK